MIAINDDVFTENGKIKEIRLPAGRFRNLPPSLDLELQDLLRVNELRRFNCAQDIDRSRAYQYLRDPPRHMIFSGFDGIQRLVTELRLPSGPDDMYYSVLIRGYDFTNIVRPTCQNLYKYTVEFFGLRIKSINSLDGSFKEAKIPDPSKYARPPKYWRESPGELIQVWRTRVFVCLPEDLKTSPSDPISPRWPDFPYLEDIWYPRRSRIDLPIRGLHSMEVGLSLCDFYCNINDGSLKSSSKVGRPPGSGRYPEEDDFYRPMMKAHSDLWERNKIKPNRKQVALEMSIPYSSFGWYWTRTARARSLRWEDIPKP